MLEPLATVKDEPKLRQLLICPIPETRGDKDVVPVIVIEGVKDLVNAIDQPVVACENLRLIEMLINYADVFEVQPVLLLGYPSATYSAAFEQLTWNLDRVPYDTLVSDIIATERVDKTIRRDAGVRPVRETVSTGKIAPKRGAYSTFDVVGATESDGEIDMEVPND